MRGGVGDTFFGFEMDGKEDMIFAFKVLHFAG
jgi:hypothetical protein